MVDIKSLVSLQDLHLHGIFLRHVFKVPPQSSEGSRQGSNPRMDDVLLLSPRGQRVRMPF